VTIIVCSFNLTRRPLLQRVLHMNNHHTGMNLQSPGQDAFTIIQYNPDDQYT